MKKQLEIERRWLLPNNIDISSIFSSQNVEYDKYTFTQFYLINEHTERIRQVIHPNKCITFVHTIKTPTENGIGNFEIEKDITEEEFLILLKRTKPKAQTIIKNRYVFELEGFKYELDQFIHPVNFRILEIEIPSMDVNIPLPEYLGEAIEITGEKLLSNHKIALAPLVAQKRIKKILKKS